MRALYIPPNQTQFDSLFSNRGSGISDIKVYNPHLRGGSFLSVIGRIVRGAIPFLKNIFLPEIPSFINNVSDDMNSGMKLKDSLKRRSMDSALNVGDKIIKRARGGRIKRKKKNTKRKNAKNKCKSSKNKQVTRKSRKKKMIRSKNDIFSSFE